MKKEKDYGAFNYNTRDWKITPKTELYNKSHDRIFKRCVNCYYHKDNYGDCRGIDEKDKKCFKLNVEENKNV